MIKIQLLLKKYSNEICIVIITFLWLLILVLSGAYHSGFHFTDDHGIISISTTIKEDGYWDTLMYWIKSDLAIRLRSFYWVQHVTLVYILDTNWQLWALYHLFFTVVTTLLFWLIGKKLGLSPYTSLLASLLILLGEQSEIFWRTSTAEYPGMLFLSVSIYCWLTSESRHWLKITSLIFFVLASLCKESFILLIPAAMVGIIFQGYVSDKFSITHIKLIIQKNLGYLVAIGLVFIVELFIIKFYSIGGTGYAGVDTDSNSILKIFLGIDRKLNIKGVIMHFLLSLTDFKANTNRYGMIAFLFVFIGITYYYSSKKINFLDGIKSININHLFILFIFLLIYIPQLILYKKSGFGGRYIVPISIAYTLLIIYIYKHIAVNQALKIIGFCIISFFLTYQFSYTLNTVVLYAHEGKETNRFLDQLLLSASTDSDILIVADPPYNYEHTYSLNTYLISKKPHLKLHHLLIEQDNNLNDFYKELSAGLKASLKKSIVPEENKNVDLDFKIIAVFIGVENKFVKEYKKYIHIDLSQYKRQEFSNMVLYLK